MQYGDAIGVLRCLPLFSKLNPSKLKLLAFSSTYLIFEAGEELFQEGDPADGAYIIDEGEVEVLIALDGRQITVGTLHRQDLFGEMAIILNQPRTATIRAATPLKVLKIDASVFLKLVTESPDAALAVMRSLSDKIARVTERYQHLESRLHAEPPPSEASSETAVRSD